MLFSELSSRMVDVLGISLVRLLAESQDKKYDEIKKISEEVSEWIIGNKTITKETLHTVERGDFLRGLSRRDMFRNNLMRYTYLQSGKELYQWWKCPQHGTWLQPEYKPYPHWACWYWQGCDFKRPAKLRSKIERSIFNLARFLDNGEEKNNSSS